MAPMPPKRSTKPAQSKPSPSQSKPQSKAAKNTANGGQIKTKRAAPTVSARSKDKKKKRSYTDKELSLPTLNMITPAGVEKPRGKKKGKVFVDDAASMRTILAIVSADREGQIESKMQKARQMEEIRESRRVEMEDKEASKKKKLEDVKNGLRKKRTKSHAEDVTPEHGEAQRKGGAKRVSFG